MSPGPGLVNRRATQTRLDIVRAATALFRAQGYDDTPMAAIADAAGVSRRTLYRYFPTKEDIVFESPREWLEVFESEVATRADGESTRDLMIRALTAVIDHVQSHREQVAEEFTILQASAALRARRARSDDEWIGRYLELLAPDVDGDVSGMLQASVCAMALVAAQNALMVVWATGPPDLDAATLATAMFEQVDCIWPAGSR